MNSYLMYLFGMIGFIVAVGTAIFAVIAVIAFFIEWKRIAERTEDLLGYIHHDEQQIRDFIEDYMMNRYRNYVAEQDDKENSEENE